MYKLMIVDDELLMRVGIRSMLNWEEFGFHVVGEAGNGKEALELALEVSPDLIITDIKMPVMDGLKLIQEASCVLKTCKYVILSNFDEFHYVKEALKLGAADYLIKSEITESSLSELLTTVTLKLQSEQISPANVPSVTIDYSKSLRHLKDSFFQDIVSGFINEKEIMVRAEELQFRIRSDQLVIIKFFVNYYEKAKKKYIEKGEKLLRFSLLNIMEEIIPSKWEKEIFVESSSEYWVVVNVLPETSSIHDDLNKLCTKLLSSIKDFMNLSLTAAVSTIVSDFRYIRKACEQAEFALHHGFFTGSNQVLHYNDVLQAPPRQEVHEMLNPEQERNFLKLWVSKDYNSAKDFLQTIRSDLEAQRANESSVRKQYILLMETIQSHLSRGTERGKRNSTEKSPYEIVLKGESWEDIHQDMLDYIAYYFKANSQDMQEHTHADVAIEMINKYYAEDISLQGVANQINVNPSYLSRLFKQEKGENFITYLTRVRMEHAKNYLLSKELRVYEIAEKVGYHNYTYFSKIFKRSVGHTPEEYRDLQQESL
ncbi:response regulator transcription factor [Paenibacillus tundrae]|uniref:Two-component system response regulator YesN n=1 Tax=Paenibacillus tundrae TaxID=528187 RepID=A0ABT9W7Z0_9BACL|nr:helix-turn-helix domain-containing protein [Paenibacillus tundrae]MDQ0169363.1 two-component system response regulator YesN [Paenibacillus tundrae]